MTVSIRFADLPRNDAAGKTIHTRILRWVATCLVVGLAATSISGCAVTEEDLTRWETTLGGPKRLSAVVLHDKYPHELRVQAAMALIRMKPRKGQVVGIDRLIKGTLVCDQEYIKPGEPCQRSQLSPEARGKILADLIPMVIEELEKEPPKPAQKGQTPPDPSFKFKDAAFLMLTYEKTQVVADEALRKLLGSALTDWAMADFDRRLNDRGQAYGMEQLLRHVGPSSVVRLPEQMTKDGKNLAKIADMVAKIGSQDTREAASKKLVEIVKYTASQEWGKEKLPELKEANRKAGFDPTDKQLEKQLADFQNESVVRVYASMKKVGGEAVVTYCLDVAADKKQEAARRQTALAALEGHISRKNDGHIKQLFEIAKSDAPPEVIDQTFRRIRELPREKVIDQLYGFFESKDWKLRRLAGATILQMSTAKDVGEFVAKLDEKATNNFNLPEAITYGAYLGGLKEGKPLEALEPLMTKAGVRGRLSAISYWYEFGNKKTLDKVKPYEQDGTKVPACDEEAGCDWTCMVGSGEKKESKEIKTVGDFASFCIKPKMEATDPEKDAKKATPEDDKQAPNPGSEGKKDDDKDDKNNGQ